MVLNILGYQLSYRGASSFFQTQANVGALNECLSYIFLILIIANIILLLLPMFKENFKNKKWFSIINVISIILLIVISVLGSIRDDYGYLATISTLFYVEIFILLINMFLSFYKNFSKSNENSNVK